MSYNRRTMSSRDTRVRSADASRSKTVITQDDVRLKDQENPFSFKQFVKRKNRSAPVEREKDNKMPVEKVKDDKVSLEREKTYKGPRTYTMASKGSVPSKKRERTVKFQEPSFSNPSIDELKDYEENKNDGSDDNSDDDWSESYLPSFVEQALKDSRSAIPIARNDLDAFSFTSADLVDVPSWQVNHEKDSSSILPDAFQSTDDSSTSLTDVSHVTVDSGSSVPSVVRGTCAFSPLLPDTSFESADRNSQLDDVSSGKSDYCLQLSEGLCRKAEPDFVAHGDVPGDSNILSLQRNCDELTEKNSGLRKTMELMKNLSEEQTDRIRILEKKLAEKQFNEEKEAKALEFMAQQVEVNLKTMTGITKKFPLPPAATSSSLPIASYLRETVSLAHTMKVCLGENKMRAIRSEKNVAKLKDSIATLKAELELLKDENSKLRNMESVGLHAAKQNVQVALESLHKVIYDAQSSVQHLVTGGETLKFVTGILKAIDRISELPPEQQ